jgi:hypothetical protein
MGKKYILLLIIGIFSMATLQILSRYLEIPDFIYGLLFGTSLGFIILALVKTRKKARLQN